MRWIAPSILVLVPWTWFAIRDTNPVVNPIATLMPVIAAMASIATLSWARVTDRPRFALVAFSLALLAIVVVLEPRLPQHSPAPVTAFRVVSSNTFLGNPRPNAAAQALLSRDADVLVAVENDGATAQLFARDFPSAQTQHQGDIAVFSRWPISSPRSVRLVTGWFDVMRVEILRPGAPFIVYAMHLGNPVFKTTYTQHAHMVERLVAAAQAEDLPVVLAGDFNMSDRSASYRALDGAFRDTMRASFADTTYDNALWMLLQLRIDYIFVSRSLCAGSSTTFTVPGSDHDGLEVEIGTCPT